MTLRERVWDGIDLINLVQGNAKWQVVVSTVMKLGLHNVCGISELAKEPHAFQEGLCFLHLSTYTEYTL